MYSLEKSIKASEDSEQDLYTFSHRPQTFVLLLAVATSKLVPCFELQIEFAAGRKQKQQKKHVTLKIWNENKNK